MRVVLTATLLFACTLVACPEPPRAPVKAILPPPSAPIPPLPRAEGKVDVQVLGAETDGAWVNLHFIPDPKIAAQKCYADALASDAALTGHVTFFLARMQGNMNKLERVDASPLPAPLLDCLARAVAEIHTPEDEGLTPNVPDSHVYITLW